MTQPAAAWLTHLSTSHTGVLPQHRTTPQHFFWPMHRHDFSDTKVEDLVFIFTDLDSDFLSYFECFFDLYTGFDWFYIGNLIFLRKILGACGASGPLTLEALAFELATPVRRRFFDFLAKPKSQKIDLGRRAEPGVVGPKAQPVLLRLRRESWIFDLFLTFFWPFFDVFFEIFSKIEKKNFLDFFSQNEQCFFGEPPSRRAPPQGGRGVSPKG